MDPPPRPLTASRLEELSLLAAGALGCIGVRAGSLVAVLVAGPVELVAVILGAHRLGATCAVLDVGASRADTIEALERLSPDAVVTRPLTQTEQPYVA